MKAWNRGEPGGRGRVYYAMGNRQEILKAGACGSPSGLAKALAPEDIRRGDFVATLYVVSEWPSFHWCGDDALRARDEVVRLALAPATPAEPLRVRRVCLPFVLAKSACGEVRTVDVRLCRLARLDRTFARSSWRAARKAAKRSAKASQAKL